MLDTEEKALAKVQGLMRGCLGHDLLSAMALEHLNTGGKYVRSRLALKAAHALGVAYEECVGWAAACELAHNATLVHDDLQDGDTHRRGKLTVWKQHGAVQAINVGDMLLMVPYSVLQQGCSCAEKQALLSRVMSHGMVEVIKGQALEYAHTQKGDVSRAGYEAAVRGKTGALFALPVEGAAVLAGCTEEQVRTYVKCFGVLGLLFQMQDDVLDLYGDKGRDKKGMDLAEGKISALVVEHCEQHPQDTDRLKRVLALPREATPEEEVSFFMGEFEKKGTLESVLNRMQVLCEEGVTMFEHPTHEALLGLWKNMCVDIMAPLRHLRIFHF